MWSYVVDIAALGLALALAIAILGCTHSARMSSGPQATIQTMPPPNACEAEPFDRPCVESKWRGSTP